MYNRGKYNEKMVFNIYFNIFNNNIGLCNFAKWRGGGEYGLGITDWV